MALPILLIAGCGGGSPATNGYPDGGGVLTNTPAGPGVSTGSAMLTLRGGMNWNYKLTGTISREFYDLNGSRRLESGAVTGTMSRTLSDATFNGMPCLKMVDVMNYTPAGGSPTVQQSIKFAQQNIDGSLTMIGYRDREVDFVVANTSPVWVGAFTLGSSVSNSARFVQGPTDYQASKSTEMSFVVAGQESVASTTAGVPFSTWKVSTSYTDQTLILPIPRVSVGIILPKGFVIQSDKSNTAIEWWSPTLGASVALDQTINQTDTVLLSWSYSAGSFTSTTDTLRTSGQLRMTLQTRSLP